MRWLRSRPFAEHQAGLFCGMSWLSHTSKNSTFLAIKKKIAGPPLQPPPAPLAFNSLSSVAGLGPVTLAKVVR